MLLAAALPWVSEDTYRDLTTTLRGGIALTDARIQTNRLLALRSELLRNLELAATQLQQARTSIYDALLVNRVAVGSLTQLALLCLFLFLRQLRVQNRDRARPDRALRQERKQLEEEIERRTDRLTRLAKHLQSVREDDRAHLARELHDELGDLTASKLAQFRAKSRGGSMTVSSAPGHGDRVHIDFPQSAAEAA